jgi:hypothetical protein
LRAPLKKSPQGTIKNFNPLATSSTAKRVNSNPCSAWLAGEQKKMNYQKRRALHHTKSGHGKKGPPLKTDPLLIIYTRTQAGRQAAEIFFVLLHRRLMLLR